jgi:GNAT superfamily N-acetyltransferase
MIVCNDATIQQYLTYMNEANLCEFSLQLGMGGEVYDGSDVKWVYTGNMGLNRVLDARFSHDDAEDRINELLEMFAGRGTMPHWITSPSTTPRDMMERLERRGFQHVPWSGMAADLNNLPDTIAKPEALRILEVTSPALMRPWSQTMCRGFGWPDDVYESVYRLFAGLGVCGLIPWHHYLGYIDDQPVSTCTVYEGSGSLGVYMVSVIPSFRHQGIGTATTWHALRDAREAGHRIAVLQASPMGNRVYESLAFEKHCDMTLYMPALSQDWATREFSSPQ